MLGGWVSQNSPGKENAGVQGQRGSQPGELELPASLPQQMCAWGKMLNFLAVK